jgi:hypothetical protein
VSGAAEIDDAKLTMTARTNEKEKRIICDWCDIGSNNSEEDNTEEDGLRTVGFYVLNTVI